MNSILRQAVKKELKKLGYTRRTASGRKAFKKQIKAVYAATEQRLMQGGLP